MTLRVYNTLSREKELFEPVLPGKVGMYLCGPTVYKPSHIGHAVGPIIFDVVKRYLTYKGYQVRWVVNITDVEDKIIAEAHAQGRDVMELARDIERQYVDGLSRLGVRSIDALPRASDYIPGMIEHISALIEKGYAYAVDGDVYFNVERDQDYGKLSKRRPDEQLSGTRDGLVDRGKRGPGDFALWKAAKPEEPAAVRFESPWGAGRPGWHIECSVMSAKLLGETFDIHGGGMDLLFPHHENEIAQSESLTGKPLAKYWMHNGLTRFNTKKISKSDGQMQRVMTDLLISNLLLKYPAELLRFLILSSHYRAPIDFSPDTIDAARKGLSTFHRLFERVERVTGASAYQSAGRIEQARDKVSAPAEAAFIDEILGEQVRFLEAMDDDFNTAGAIGVLFDLAGRVNRFIEQTRLDVTRDDRIAALVAGASGTLMLVGRLLGLFEQPPQSQSVGGDELTGDLVELLIDVRAMSRKAKQFEIGDTIRKRLDDLGVVLEDRADGTSWRRK